MGPQGRNAVIVLIASAAMFAATFRVDLEKGSTDLPYGDFLWGALVLSLILVRDLWHGRDGDVALGRPRPRPHSQPLLAILTMMVILNVVIHLATWERIQELPEFLGVAEENRRQAIFLFVLSALLLFARGLSTEAVGAVRARTNRFSGCLGYLLLLSMAAHALELIARNGLRYPDLSSNHATVFVASLAVVILIRDGIRSLRGRTEDRSLRGNYAR